MNGKTQGTLLEGVTRLCGWKGQWPWGHSVSNSKSHVSPLSSTSAGTRSLFDDNIIKSCFSSNSPSMHPECVKFFEKESTADYELILYNTSRLSVFSTTCFLRQEPRQRRQKIIKHTEEHPQCKFSFSLPFTGDAYKIHGNPFALSQGMGVEE